MATLAEKIDAARGLLSEQLAEHGPGGLVCAFTGGKDSTLALWLLRGVLAEAEAGPVRALSIDTGCKFPEVVAFRDGLAAEWDVDLSVVRPEVLPDVLMDGYPLAEDPLACCRELKVEPLKRAIRELGVGVLVTGLRADEHASRAGLPALERREDPQHLRAHPLLEFTEMDVWAAITQERLPHCGLYAEGYRSLGCMPCTRKATVMDGERAGRNPDKERHLRRLQSLGYF